MRHGARYLLVDVFTDRPFGGNQLAVFPDGRSVPAELMPVIARELNLSETVFVLPPETEGNAARLRIFTPGSELPFAGHPTVGAACVLAAEGLVRTEHQGGDLTLELGVGEVQARVTGRGRVRRARFDVPQIPARSAEPPPRAHVAAAVRLTEDDLDVPDWHPEAWSCGVPFLFVPVRDRGALKRAELDPAVWARWIGQSDAPHLYLVSPDPELPGSAYRARMFAPALGIPEDPATGSAASALAGFLGVREAKADGHFSWRIEQGFEMGRPSLIDVELEKAEGKPVLVRIVGDCVLMGEGRMDLS